MRRKKNNFIFLMQYRFNLYVKVLYKIIYLTVELLRPLRNDKNYLRP